MPNPQNKPRQPNKSLILQKFSQIVEWIILVILAAMCFVGLKHPYPEMKNEKSYLQRLASVTIPAHDQQLRLQTLTSIALQDQSTRVEESSTLANQRSQDRLFFSAILAALIIASFASHDPEMRSLTTLAVIAFTFIVYFNDVQSADLELREAHQKAYVDNAVDSLANVQPKDFSLYQFDMSDMHKFDSTMQAQHRSRIVSEFSRPQIGQIVFNLGPLIIVLLIRRLRELL